MEDLILCGRFDYDDQDADGNPQRIPLVIIPTPYNEVEQRIFEFLQSTTTELFLSVTDYDVLGSRMPEYTLSTRSRVEMEKEFTSNLTSTRFYDELDE